MDDLTRPSLWYLKLLVFQCLGDCLGWGILGDPGAVSREDAILILGRKVISRAEAPGNLLLQYQFQKFFWPISGTNTKISGTGTVRVSKFPGAVLPLTSCVSEAGMGVRRKDDRPWERGLVRPQTVSRDTLDAITFIRWTLLNEIFKAVGRVAFVFPDIM